MNNIDKWLERVYGETDFGRSIATSIAGAVGLVIYLALDDWVISIFAAVIAFPIARLLATWLYERARRASNRSLEYEQAQHFYNNLSDEEKEVVQAFVKAGGSVLTWSQINHLDLCTSAIESLLSREFLRTSSTADQMRETFVLDPDIFNAGLREARRFKNIQN